MIAPPKKRRSERNEESEIFRVAQDDVHREKWQIFAENFEELHFF